MIVDFFEYIFKLNIFCKRFRNFLEFFLFFIDGIVIFKSVLFEEKNIFIKLLINFVLFNLKLIIVILK